MIQYSSKAPPPDYTVDAPFKEGRIFFHRPDSWSGEGRAQLKGAALFPHGWDGFRIDRYFASDTENILVAWKRRPQETQLLTLEWLPEGGEPVHPLTFEIREG